MTMMLDIDAARATGRARRGEKAQCPVCGHTRVMYSKAMCKSCRKRMTVNDDRQCSVKGCERIRDTKGMCGMHAENERRNNKPAVVRKVNNVELDPAFVAGMERANDKVRERLDQVYYKRVALQRRSGVPEWSRKKVYRDLGFEYLYKPTDLSESA